MSRSGEGMATRWRMQAGERTRAERTWMENKGCEVSPETGQKSDPAGPWSTHFVPGARGSHGQSQTGM